MHLIWKRPDGYESAKPEDFKRLKLTNGGQIWLHCRDTKWYPFQVSGDWQGSDATEKINTLVNLLDAPANQMRRYLETLMDESHSPDSTLQKTVEELVSWLKVLKLKLKGDAWELEILNGTLNDIEHHLHKALQLPPAN